jgi:N-hydroxyarylamine O-acetyltransferase
MRYLPGLGLRAPAQTTTAIIASALGLDHVSPDATFAELGVEAVVGTRILAGVFSAFDLPLPVSSLSPRVRVGAFATLVADQHLAAAPATAAALPPDSLSPQELGSLLDRLEPREFVAASKEGLVEVYRAWCRSVPTDNVLRRISPPSEGRGPGECQPSRFVADFLEHGVGGCGTSAAAALEAALRGLGYVTRAVVVAAVGSGGPRPHHAAVSVSVDTADFLLDTVIRCEAPIPLVPRGSVSIAHHLHPIRVERGEGGWRVSHRDRTTMTLAHSYVLDTRVGPEARRALHRGVRRGPAAGGFDPGLQIHRNGPGSVLALSGDRSVVIDGRGRGERRIGPGERRRLLVERFGLSAEIAGRMR